MKGKKHPIDVCYESVGPFLPSHFFLLVKSVDKNDLFMIAAPLDSIAIPHESVGMNGAIFLMWLQHFKQHVLPTKDNPVLLILDGHSSNKEFAVIEYVRANNIHMLTTPPHTKHKLQPLDRVFFTPSKAAFASASAVWIRCNSDTDASITNYDITSLDNLAFAEAARLRNYLIVFQLEL